METSSDVITINPVEYTEKMRRVLQNFTQLSRQAVTVQHELGVFDGDINNLAAHFFSLYGEEYAKARLSALQTTLYEVAHDGPSATVKVNFISAIEEYSKEVTFEINCDTGEIIRTDTEITDETQDNGRIDRKIDYVRKRAEHPADIISHMNADMFMMVRNHTAIGLGRVAS